MATELLESLLPGESEFVSGSFRDRDGRVFLRDERVFRAVSARALASWDAVSETACLQRAMASGRVVATEVAERVAEPSEGAGHWAGVLRHQRIEFLSWPYEWSFSMLKDAALLQLELMQEALAEDVILKDASPYNIQFDGSTPRFIDTASFVPLPAGGIWEGYRQFCQLFLYPLMMQAYLGLDFQPFLRGRLDGISPEQFRRMLSARDMFRKGVFSHVVLHSHFSSTGAASEQQVSDSLRKSGFQKSLIQNNVAALTRLIQRLSWDPGQSTWSEYDAASDPVRLDAEAKETFVRKTLSTRDWNQAWDVGCNLGRYSRIAAQHAQLVVAMDSDHLTVDRLYRSLRQEHAGRITPLVFNLADPSPDLGWRCSERTQLTSRSAPDIVLFLAVIHHLVIGANLLLPELIGWLAELRSALVIEFVDRDDPQVVSLLRNRSDVFHDYSRDAFERSLNRCFEVRESTDLPSGTRTLYYATPRT
jgi:hypothetical protein